ncbi:MAG: hypothetical protein CSA52_02925 [Gammaproteobacteria bacterium]|nr:MAG: hypothetical protein CSB48_04595 [Pseudomonadota bacterium]PIE38352.1 MAG: hypothetical protein CSA52_02925 [Gammaproteobacteria bacterium]
MFGNGEASGKSWLAPEKSRHNDNEYPRLSNNGKRIVTPLAPLGIDRSRKSDYIAFVRGSIVYTLPDQIRVNGVSNVSP